MTSRQTLLTSYLRRRGDWASTEELINAFVSAPEYGGYPPIPAGKSIHDSTARRQLTTDVQQINRDDGFHGIIIHGDRGYKLATAEEALRFAMAEKAEALRKLKRYYTLSRKAGQDGQADLFGEIRQMIAEA